MADDLTDALAAAHAEQRAARNYAAGVTPEQVTGLTALSVAHPNLGAAALPLARAGVKPDSPVAQRAAEAKVKRDRKKPPPTGTVTFGGRLAVADTKEGGFGHVVSRAAKEAAQTVTRYGSAGASFPLEYTMGTIRTAASGLGITEGEGTLADLLDPAKIAKQTTVGAGVAEAHDRGRLLEMLKDAVGPGESDEELAGSGWFIDPKGSITGRRQGAEARAAAMVDGHAFTLGRGLAHALPFEPGTKGYNIVSGLTDLGATLALDPLTYVGGAAAKGNRVRNVLDRGNAVEVELATRTAREGGITRKFAVGADGEATRINVSAETGMVDGVRKTVLPEVAAQWLMGPKGDKVVTHLAGETDFERMRRATGKKLPVSVLVDLVDAEDTVAVRNILADAISQGQVRDKLTFTPERFGRPRLAGMMPGDKIDLEDVDDAVEQLDRFQRNVRLDPADISKNNEALARAATKGERYQVVETVMGVIEKGLVKGGVDPEDARAVTRMFDDARTTMQRYAVDEIGENAHIPGAVLGGDGKPLPTPHLLAELIDQYIPLPDARELIRANRKYKALKRIEQSLPYKGSRITADFLTSTLFKPFALALRPAWTVRVVGEEQIRMGAAGLDSAFHHPLSYVAWMLGEKPGRLNKLIGRGDVDVLGQRWHDEAALPDAVTEFQQALNRGSAGWRDRARILTRHYGVFQKRDPEYAEGWAGELIQLSADPVAREVLRNGPVVAKNKFWGGNLSRHRDELHRGGIGGNLLVRENADAYVDSVIERIHVKTQGHSDLLEAVKTGRLQGNVLTDGFNVNPKAVKVLRELKDQGPPLVKGRLQVKAAGDGDSLNAAARMYDDVVERLFHALGSVPTNRLSRSPVFRQRYWQRIEEVLPLLTKSERVRAVRAAKEAGLSRATVKRMRETVDRQTVSGDLLLEDADDVAKAFALRETRDLLYSLHEKSQAADAMRVLFPFGEAWREVLTRWVKLGVDPRTMNPKVPYRAQQILTGAKEAGIFYTDPTTGQEMFALPGSEWITEKFTGVPMRLEAPVSGLNMFGQVIPGVGPVVAFAASQMIPPSPKYDDLRGMMLPFGDPDYSGGAVESLLPAYLKKALTAAGAGTPEQKRLLGSLKADVMVYLHSTGDYNLSDPADQQRLQDDANDKARALYFMRALAQSTAPSSPQGRLGALDKDGRIHTLFALKEDYRRMLDADPASATSAFIDKYGDLAFLATISKTRDKGANPVNENVDLLTRSHPDQAKRYPNVIGLFADPTDVYSFTEYDRQIAAGTREVQTLEDMVRLSNIRLGNAAMARARQKDSDPVFLRSVRDRLKRQFPGWTGQPDDLGRTDSLVQELIRANKDEVLRQTDAGKGLAKYLRFRAQAAQVASDAGYAGFTESKATAPLRNWLREQGERIATRHPAFEQMWDRVFLRELPEDEE